MKLSKQTRNFLAYIIGTTVVLFGTVLLVGFAAGWQYDFSTGEIRDTGLIIMNSEPSGARIIVNNTEIKSKTPYRYANALPGDYTVSYRKDSYRPWVRQTRVEAEAVTFNDYAWLIPENVPQRSRYTDKNIVGSVQSIDRRRTILVNQPTTTAGQATVAPQILVTNDWTKASSVLYAPTVAPSAPTTPAPTQVVSFDQLQLSPDGSTLLVRETFVNGTQQYLIIPTNPSDSARITNLTTETNLPFDWYQWGPSGAGEIWVKQSGKIQRWLVNDHRLEDTGVNNVLWADWSQDKLLTVETTPDGNRIFVARDNDSLDSPETVSQIAASASYKAEYSRWLDHDYISILTTDDQNLWLARDIFLNKNQRILSPLGQSISDFTVNRTGRYIVFNQKDRFVSVDIERKQRARWQANLTGLTNWEWANDQHLVLKLGKELRVIDFDGQNNELISSNVTPSTPILFGDNKSIVSLSTVTKDAQTSDVFLQYFLNPEKVVE